MHRWAQKLIIIKFCNYYLWSIHLQHKAPLYELETFLHQQRSQNHRICSCSTFAGSGHLTNVKRWIRGRPLMIWGGAEENWKMNLFFPREDLLEIIFSRRRSLGIYFFPENPFWNELFFQGGLLEFIFSWGWLPNFFPLYKPIKKVPKFFFLSRKFVWIYFSLGEAF